MTVLIKEVTKLKDLKTFVRFPYSLYRDHPCWVPLLDGDEINTLRRDKNPAFDYCQARYWLAYKDGQLAGRIAAIHNRLHIEKWRQPILRFGWIDFIDDPEVSAALFGAVESWAGELNLPAVHGPLGFTDMDREGMLVEGFDQVGTMATFYNHPYYPIHLERLGYVKDVDWLEYKITMPTEPPAGIYKLSDLLLKRYNLRLLKTKSKKEFFTYADQVFDLLEDGYKNLYGVTPLTPRQREVYKNQYFGFLSPEFVPIILDANDRAVAFGITMPSLTRALQKARGKLLPLGIVYLLDAMRKNDSADLYLVAVKDEYMGRGLNAILMCQLYEVFKARGIKNIESNPELETNLNVRTQWKHFETRQHKRRRVYIKQLS